MDLAEEELVVHMEVQSISGVLVVQERCPYEELEG